MYSLAIFEPDAFEKNYFIFVTEYSIAHEHQMKTILRSNEILFSISFESFQAETTVCIIASDTQ